MGKAEQVQGVVQKREKQDTEERPGHLPLPPEQARPADDGGTDHVEQEALAKHG